MSKQKPSPTQAVIVAVGTELLFGSTVNTNAAEMSQMLHDIGIGVLAHYTVGDNPQRLKRMLEVAFELADIVLVCGGLGPTQDDLTKEVIAEVFNTELIHDKEAERQIMERFIKLEHPHFTENNKKQAYLPYGSTPFYNSVGTAPGFALETTSGKLIIALPGPPHEMRQMMIESALPLLSGRSGYTIYSEMLTFIGIGESTLETILMPLIDGQSDPTIATYAKKGECNVRITSMRVEANEARAAAQTMAKQAKELVAAYLIKD